MWVLSSFGILFPACLAASTWNVNLPKGLYRPADSGPPISSSYGLVLTTYYGAEKNDRLLVADRAAKTWIAHEISKGQDRGQDYGSIQAESWESLNQTLAQLPLPVAPPAATWCARARHKLRRQLKRRHMYTYTERFFLGLHLGLLGPAAAAGLGSGIVGLRTYLRRMDANIARLEAERDARRRIVARLSAVRQAEPGAAHRREFDSAMDLQRTPRPNPDRASELVAPEEDRNRRKSGTESQAEGASTAPSVGAPS